MFGSLIQPFAYRQNLFPGTSFFRTGVGGHVNGCSGNRPRALTAAHTVANLTARTGRRTVERFYCCGKVMCFRFQGDDTLDVLYLEIVGLGVVCRSKLFDNRTFGKGYIVFVGRDNLVGILLCSLLYHLEE